MTDQKSYLRDDSLITTHHAEDYEHYYNAVVPPVFMNSLHVFETLDSFYSADPHDMHQYCYGRVQNPTVRIFEEKVAALEQGTGAAAFASGMAAASTAVLACVKDESHVVCIRNAYGPLRTFLTGYCAEHMHVKTTFVDGRDLQEFEEAVTDKTDLVILESPSSIVFSLQDIREVSALAHRHGALVYIDNTFCTPIFQKPLQMGADIVMHTTSKYIGGHSDVIGGVLAVRDRALFEKLLQMRELLGGIVGPMEAWLMIRGLRTLPVRVRQHQETALAVAQFLKKHERVKKVNYPGLTCHPQYELMCRQQEGNTGLLSFEIDGTVEQAVKVTEALRIFKIGVSWGGFESLVFMPHMKMSSEECKILGGEPQIIRIHCGLEGTKYLLEDLESALAGI